MLPAPVGILKLVRRWRSHGAVRPPSGSIRVRPLSGMSDAWIQTKLLRHEADNASRAYGIGDSEVLVGLEDYCPLHPWGGSSPLTVAVGDWACGHCGLNWQWAAVVFEVSAAGDRQVVTLCDLIGLQPCRPDKLDGVHFVEADLAELSGMWEMSVGRAR